MLPQTGPSIFLSYSRRDAAFADALEGALNERNYDCDYDRSERDPANIARGIAAGDEWWERIREKIASCETMIFVVSPDSAASKVCDEEIAYARILGKRVIPVLLRAIDPKSAPPRLAALNIKISFEQDGNFHSALSALCAAIDVDARWHREAARLTDLAVRWSDNGEPSSALLRLDAVTAAEAHLRQRPPGAANPADTLMAFLDASRAKEIQERDRLLTITGRAFVAPARQAFHDQRYCEAMRCAAAGILLSDADGRRLVPESLWAISDSGCRQRLLSITRGHEKRINSVTLDRTGSRILTASADGTARIWDFETQDEIARLSPNRGELKRAEFSSDGRLVLVVGKTGWVQIADAMSAATVAQFDIGGGEWTYAALDVQGRLLLVASSAKGAHIFDIRSGKALRQLIGHKDEINSAKFSGDGRYIVTASKDKTARIWNANTGAQVKCLRGHGGAVWWAAFSQDAEYVVTISRDQAARVWNVRTGEELAKTVFPRRPDGTSALVYRAEFNITATRILFEGPIEPIVWEWRAGKSVLELKGLSSSTHDVSFSPDGERVAAASIDCTVRIWDARSGAELLCLNEHESWVNGICFTPDGKRIVSVADDVRVWDLATSHEILRLGGHRSLLRCAATSLDGQCIMTASQDQVRIWSPSGALTAELAILEPEEDAMMEMAARPALSPDGSCVAVAREDGSFSLWSSATGLELVALVKGNFEDVVRCCCFSPCGLLLAVGTEEGTVRAWDVASRQELFPAVRLPNSILSIAFSPDGTRMAVSFGDGVVRVLDALAGANLLEMHEHKQWVKTVAYCPEGSRLVSCGDETPRVWDARTGVQIAKLEGHSEWVMSAQFSKDGGRILTVSADHSARLWDADSGEELARLAGHDGSIMCAALSDDGRRVVTASDDWTARIWDAVTGLELQCLTGHDETVVTVGFTEDGARVLSCSSDGTARLWDVRHSLALTSDMVVGLAANLARGRGVRGRYDRNNLLMQLAPDDLYENLVEHLTQNLSGPESEEVRTDISRRTTTLAQALHPNCYLTPSQRNDISDRLAWVPKRATIEKSKRRGRRGWWS